MRLIDVDALMEGRYIQRGEKTIGRRTYVTFEEIEAAPTIEERKTGRWINGKCDQCGEHAPFWSMATTYHKSNFCPNCGARMEGGE